MMAVLFIVVIISSVILANHTKFNSVILLKNLAYDIALSIREAQLFAFSVRQVQPVSGPIGNFDVGYGIHFDKDESAKYLFFADANANNSFDPVGGGDFCSGECIKQFDIKGYSIADVCAFSGGVVDCFSCSTPNNLDSLDISFLRPDPDATLTGSLGGVYGTYQSALIDIASQAGTHRYVEVFPTGQIAVLNEPTIVPSCP